MKHVLVQVSA